MSGSLASISSNFLAIAAAVLGVLAAIAASLSALQASRETDASVEKAKAEASVSIQAQSNKSALEIAKATSDSEMKIAEAKRDAAQANARAAVLEQEAAHAKLQLAQIAHGVGARKLGADQRDAIVRALRGKITANFVVDGVAGDPESNAYAFQIGEALEAAGMKPRREPHPYLGLGLMSGPANPIMMYSPPSKNANSAGVNDPVYAILSRELGSLGWSGSVGLDQHPDYYFIQVGRKTAPDLDAHP